MYSCTYIHTCTCTCYTISVHPVASLTPTSSDPNQCRRLRCCSNALPLPATTSMGYKLGLSGHATHKRRVKVASTPVLIIKAAYPLCSPGPLFQWQPSGLWAEFLASSMPRCRGRSDRKLCPVAHRGAGASVDHKPVKYRTGL